MAKLKVTTEGMDELLQRLEAVGQSKQEMHEVVAFSAAEAVREHLMDENRKRANAMGGKRSNFYSRAAESTTFRATEKEAEVSVTAQGFALRFYGGLVKPTKARALTIPARAEAYGLGAREPGVPDLTAFYFKSSGNAFGGLQDEAGRVWYWLADQTEHDADKSLLPSPDSLGRTASDALAVYVESFFEENN